ncbi:MAG: hypothetical protein WD690_13075 [Vicinamibacterales bacterium]
MTPRHLLVLLAAALCFVWLHALTVPRTLEDEDSINLAMGVESFDVARYAPHPPGYPVYIALAKASTAGVTRLHPDWSRDRRAAAGLASLSVVSGALGLFAFAALWRGLGVSAGWSILAAIGTSAAPLYWFTAARPLTDTPALVTAVAIQAAFLRGLRHFSERGTLPARWVIASMAAGVAIGMRSQTMLLTLPIMLLVIVRLLRDRRWAHGALLAGAALAGVLIWLIPLVHLTGGVDEYRRLVAGQGRHDVTSVEMLATNFSWRFFGDDLVGTFLAPWRLTAVSWAIVAAAALGIVRVARTGGGSLLMLCLLVVPYMMFHLLFHEVETIRYALPTVSMMAGLSGVALAWLGNYAGATLALAGTIACVAIVHPVTATYARGAPVFRVIQDIRSARLVADEAPRLEAHHDAWWAVSRALDWNRDRLDLAPPRLIERDETLRLVEYWRSGATTPIWFFSDPDRGDLRRFDPAATRHVRTRRLTPEVASLIGGLRPYDVGWWRLSAPAWMLGRGWALTREMIDEGEHSNGAVAYLRRQPGPVRLFVGTRHLETVSSPADVSASLDGVEIDCWRLAPGDSATRWLALPEGRLQGSGAYATLAFAVSPAPSQTRVVAFGQLDAAPPDTPMVAFGDGWSRVERDAALGARWRRTSAFSHLEVRHAGRPVKLTIRGNVPVEDFTMPPPVVVYAGKTIVAELVPARVFELSFELSPEVLDAAGGRVSIAVNLRRAFDEQQRGMTPRAFGIRVASVEIE